VPPKASAVRAFLNRFHDEDIPALRPPREGQKSFSMPPGEPQKSLDGMLAGLVGQIARILRVWEIFELPTQATAFS